MKDIWNSPTSILASESVFKFYQPFNLQKSWKIIFDVEIKIEERSNLGQDFTPCICWIKWTYEDCTILTL